MKFPLIALCALTLTAACGPDPARVLIDPAPSAVKVKPSVRTVEVKKVSLPTYAEGADVTVLAGETGLVSVVPDNIWADEPSRALGAAMVRSLIQMTGVAAAAEPWPLAGFPEAEVTIRVERLLASDSGALTLSGTYALRYDAQGRRGRVRLFDIQVPVTEPGTTGLAKAQGIAWTQLAERIARDL